MKYKILLLISVLVLFILILLFRDGFQPDFFFADRNLSIRDTSLVDKILIIEKDSLYLSKNEGNLWLVNDSFQAERIAVNNFLYAFSHIEVRGKTHEVPDSIPIRKILIYMGKHRLEYSLASNQTTSYLRREGAKEYILAGITGSPGASFGKITSANPDYWRSKLLLELLPDEIKSIRVIPGMNRGEGFILEKSGKDFTLMALNGVPAPDSLINTEKVLMYISYFRGIWYEKIASGNPLTDTGSLARSFYSIEVESREGKVQRLEIFPIPDSSGEPDLFRAYVRMNGKDEIFVVKYVMLDLLMQVYSHFIV